jgi:hypothetical protein
MNTALFIIQLVTAIVLAATLVAVIIYTVKTSNLATSAQEQVTLTRQQAADQHRPLLVPDGAPIFQDKHPNWLKWEENLQPLKYRNIGPGPALNVASVLYGCESYVVGELGAQMRVSESKQRTLDSLAGPSNWTRRRDSSNSHHRSLNLLRTAQTHWAAQL